MIPKYRNQGLILVFSGIGLLIIALGTCGICLEINLRRLGGCFAVIMGLIGVIVYQWGGLVLAKAKGYSTDVAGGIVAVGLLCCGFIFLIAPLVVLCLKDKTRHNRTSRPASGTDRKTKTLAIWSISLSTLAWIAFVGGASVPSLHTQPKEPLAQLAVVTISFVAVIAPIIGAALGILVLRRDGIQNTLAIISLGLMTLLFLLLVMAAVFSTVRRSTHRHASGIRTREGLRVYASNPRRCAGWLCEHSRRTWHRSCQRFYECSSGSRLDNCLQGG